MNGVCTSAAVVQLCPVVLISKINYKWYTVTQVVFLCHYQLKLHNYFKAKYHLNSPEHDKYWTTQFRKPYKIIKLRNFSLLMPLYFAFHIYNTVSIFNTAWTLNTRFSQMSICTEVRSDSGEIKGDTANSAGRHQTWVLALTFSMTMRTE